MRPTTSLLLFPLSALCLPTNPSLASRQSPQVQFTSVSVSGSGCPSSIFPLIDDIGTTLTLGFSEYQTNVGHDVASSQRELNCDIFLSLRYPLGCVTTVMNTTYHGFSQLDSGVTGTVTVSHVLSPGTVTSGQQSSPMTFAGGVPGAVYTKKDVVRGKVDVRSENQRDVSLAVRTRVVLQARDQSVEGTLTLDDVTFTIAEAQKC
jgi:hypothetical protein